MLRRLRSAVDAVALLVPPPCSVRVALLSLPPLSASRPLSVAHLSRWSRPPPRLGFGERRCSSEPGKPNKNGRFLGTPLAPLRRLLGPLSPPSGRRRRARASASGRRLRGDGLRFAVCPALSSHRPPRAGCRGATPRSSSAPHSLGRYTRLRRTHPRQPPTRMAGAQPQMLRRTPGTSKRTRRAHASLAEPPLVVTEYQASPASIADEASRAPRLLRPYGGGRMRSCTCAR